MRATTGIFAVIWLLVTVFGIQILNLTPANADTNQSKVALVVGGLSNPFFVKMAAGARQYADDHKIPIDVFGADREADVERQISIVEDLIFRGYGAIVIDPADSTRLLPACKRALAKHLAVIIVDTPLDPQSLRKENVSIPFVGPDHRFGGQQIGEYVSRKLKGRGRVLVIDGACGRESSILRKTGFIDAMAHSPHIQMVADQRMDGCSDAVFPVAMKLLRKYNPVNAVFCTGDPAALGVLHALDILDLNHKVLVTGYDDIEAVRYEMYNDRIQASVELYPERMGRDAVRLAADAMKGLPVALLTTTPEDVVTSDTFHKKVLFTFSSLENPFFKAMQQSAQNMAKILGLDMTFSDTHNNDAAQLSEIRSAIQRRVDMLIVNPANSDTVAPGIDLAAQHHIPVISVDRRITEAPVLCHIESDNREGGRMAARIIVDKLKGRGNVVEIEGIPGAGVTLEREKGFSDALAAYPDIHVTDREFAGFNRDDARRVMLRLIQKKTPFDAVFAQNDIMMLGVLDALSGEKDAPSRVLVGFDGIPEALQQIRWGRMTATIAQKPEDMGRLAVQCAARYFRGDTIPSLLTVGIEPVTR